MASALWGKYVSEVLREVKFKYDHNGIRQELIEHMEELYEDLQAEGSVSLGAGIFFRIQLLFENVPEDLEKIEFRYDWYGDGKETISLTEGREVAE